MKPNHYRSFLHWVDNKDQEHPRKAHKFVRKLDNWGNDFDLAFAEGWSGSGSSYHHLRAGESHRLLQAFHDPGHQHSLPEAQWYQPRCLLLPQPPVSWHLDVCALSLLGSQLCALCDCKVSSRTTDLTATDLGWSGEVKHRWRTFKYYFNFS